MQSDDVKRMLEKAAAEPSRPLDARTLLKQGARLRRARFAAAAAGLAVVVGGASVTFGMMGDDRVSGPGPGPAGETVTSCEDITTATVYLKPDASRDEVRRLQAELEQAEGVAHVEHVSGSEAAAEHERALGAAPDEELQASFRVETEDASALQDLAQVRSPAIDQVLYDPLGARFRCFQKSVCDGPLAFEVSVVLLDDATDSEVEVLQGRLEDDPGVEEVRYVSGREGYRQFKRLYGDEPAALEAVSPEDVPATLQVVGVDTDAVRRIEDVSVAAAGVDEVVYGANAPATHLPNCVAEVEAADDGGGADEAPEGDHAGGPSPDRYSPVNQGAGEYPVFTDPLDDVAVALMGLSCDIGPLREDGVVVRTSGRACVVSVNVDNGSDRAVFFELREQTLSGTARKVYRPLDRAMSSLESAVALVASPIEPGESRTGIFVFRLPLREAPEALHLTLAPTGAPVVLTLGLGDCDPVEGAKADAFTCGYAR